MPNDDNVSTDIPTNTRKPRSLAVLSLYGASLVVGLSAFTYVGTVVYHMVISTSPNLGHDSPVEIAGGSIHVCHLDSSIVPTQPVTGQDWDITLLHPSDATLISIENPSGSQPIGPIPNLSGPWVIHIDDGDQGTGTPDGVTLTYAALSSADGNIHIHTRVRAGQSSESGGPHAVILPPDHRILCDSLGWCEHLNQIRFEDNVNTPTVTCAGGKCGIYIGKLRSKGSYVCEDAK